MIYLTLERASRYLEKDYEKEYCANCGCRYPVCVRRRCFFRV